MKVEILKVREYAKKYKDYIIGLRREFHMYPESSTKEFKTSQRIKKELEALHIPCSIVAGTGVVGTIHGKENGKTVLLRADIDALEVTEQNDVEYKSKNEGLMHACGHDEHIASLLGAARILNDLKDEFSGTIVVLFQPAEEIGVGAKSVIKAGVLKGVDGAFGIHISSNLDCGKMSVEEGPRMACADVFKIIIHGRSGHGARPNQAVDTVVAACATVMNLQSIVSREMNPIDPAVVTVGSIKSGTRFNIIPNEAVLEGTVRCFNEDTRKKIYESIKRIVNGTSETYRTKAEVKYDFSTSPLINDAEYSKLARQAALKVVPEEDVVLKEKTMVTDDFSEYLKYVPGLYAFVGCRNESKGACYPHHHEKFNIDEDCLEVSTSMYAQYALEFLGK